HTRILQSQKLNSPVTREAREVQRLLIHPASEVVRLSVVRKPADNFGQLSRCGLQFTFKPRIVGSRAKLIVNSTEKSCRHPDQVRAAEPVVKRHDLPDMAANRLKIARIRELRIGGIERGAEQASAWYPGRLQVI